jgi:hypothetical protein
MQLKLLLLAGVISAPLSAMQTEVPAWAKKFKNIYHCWDSTEFLARNRESIQCDEPIGEGNMFYYHTTTFYMPDSSKRILAHRFHIRADGTDSSFSMLCKRFGHCKVKEFRTPPTSDLSGDPRAEDTACTMLQRASAFAKANGYRSVYGWNKGMVDAACLQELKATCGVPCLQELKLVCNENKCSV